MKELILWVFNLFDQLSLQNILLTVAVYLLWRFVRAYERRQ
jgi:hypothetical protein